MVTDNHYRWDFVGLSTDVKPTPATSEKVVDGSTFYCSDNSKLYVYCKNNWYERKPLGGGGGGTSYTAGDGIDITEDVISVDTDVIQPKLTAGTGITITNNTISATGGGGSDFTTLTNGDANYTDASQTDWIAVWELATGAYKLDEGATINLALTAEDDYVTQSIGASQMPFLLVDNDGDYVKASIWCNDATYLGEVEISGANGSFKPFITGIENFTGTDGEDDGHAGLVPAPTTSDTNKYLKSNGTWATVSGGSVTPVQTTGTSTTDVMSQNAVTSMVYADPATLEKIKIGAGTSSSEGTNGVEIGHNAAATGNGSTSIGYDSASSALSSTAVGMNAKAQGQASASIGYYSVTRGEGSVAIGDSAFGGSINSSAGATAVGAHAAANQKGSVAVGAYSFSNTQGQMDIGTTQTGYGYNSTNYRLLSGLYDGQSAHDAMTVGQANALIDAINTALSTNISHIGS